MRIFYYFPLLIILSCTNQQKQPGNTQTIIHADKNDNSKYYTNQDSVIVSENGNDTLKYSKASFNSIVDNHSEFFKDYPNNPDLEYKCNPKGFNSELGQDQYYELYAYFLKQRTGIEQYATQRKKLIDIYSSINSLFAYFEYGGTYFGHQSKRIVGYAEYSIYLLPKNKEDFEKNYNITKQKELYIESLRQLINDENSIDFETSGKDKIERNKKLNKIVDDLNELITNNFYLKRAQEFQYEYYQYY